MAGKGIITCLETLELSNPSGPKGRAEVKKVYLTNSHILLTYSDVLSARSLRTAEDELLELVVEPLTRIQKHPTPITCLGTSENGWLVCACSEMEVILSKCDSMLKTFDSNKIGVGLGRIHSCAVGIRNEKIFVSLARFSELMVIQCIGSTSIVDVGPLDLASMEIVATSEKTPETCTWLQNQWLGDTLHIIGISSGNAVSLKIWEVTLEKHIKLKDHRMTFQSKTFSGADLTLHDDHHLLIVISPEGLAEVFTVTTAGFGLLTRIKIDESVFSPTVATLGKKAAEPTGIQIEFKVLAVRHFRFHTKLKEGDAPAEAPEIPDLNNTLGCGDGGWEYPKLLIAVASTKGLSLFNIKSGESEFCIKYQEILNGNKVISNAKLHVASGMNEMCCVVQPIFNKAAYSFRVNLEPRESTLSSCSLTSINPVPNKSVLKKKLKDPPPPPKKKQDMSRLSLHPQRFRVSEISGPAWSLNGATAAATASNSENSLVKKLKPKTAVETECVTGRPSSSGESGSHRIVPTGTYADPELNFHESQGVSHQTRLSDSLSYLRMAFSLDGKVLAAGGNDSPLVIYKTGPAFENIKVHKDPRKITAIDFPICSSNANNLLLASNDGKTEIINWKTGNEVLSLKFTSKFTEHLHAQFYYMDNFILQPEDNRLTLYSFRETMFLKAGAFPLAFQKITAVSAPNKFYSSSILCAGSNKCLQLFDAGSEKVSLTIQNAHSKSITAIRINEAPKASHATSLCDIFLTCTNSVMDPIKIWDLRSAKCINRIADLNAKTFVQSSRPAFSPCGRYIASGFEENTIVLYDIRKINSRVATIKGLQSQILDLEFDKNHPMLWCGSRNGKLWNFKTQLNR